ncbi:MAG TPA: HAD family hydrolase [Chloroflexota bacterium]|jgi:HAD superfamily hydrolase (TIGR01509 family)|nr:HAD family hydrolase [Chloroflexota bacterium]
MTVRALVFDFDGLILDTEVTMFQAWCELYQERGCELPLERWAQCIGRGTDWREHFDPFGYLEELVGARCDHAEVERWTERRHHELLAGQAPRPGVLAYLDAACALDLGLAVASSSSREWVAGHLERLRLVDRFALLRCGGDVARHKPFPDLYQAALEGLGVRPDEAVAFEDSPNGVRAARAAGIFCVAVPNPVTARLDLSHADLRLASFEELPLAELLARVDGARVPGPGCW